MSLYHIASMSSYPLYDQLLLRSSSIRERLPDDRLGITVSQFNPNNRAILYFLILHHAYLNGKQGANPYGGKLVDGKRGLTLEVGKLPETLKSIIQAFIESLKEMGC